MTRRLCMGEVSSTGATLSNVVPAKAGTHNHKERFGEDSSLWDYHHTRPIYSAV
jgi:hypothetical protein